MNELKGDSRAIQLFSAKCGHSMESMLTHTVTYSMELFSDLFSSADHAITTPTACPYISVAVLVNSRFWSVKHQYRM